LIEAPTVRRDLDREQRTAIDRPGLHARLTEGHRRLDHARGSEHDIIGQAGVADADDRPAGIFDAEDNDPAGAVIRHSTHPHGNINRACGATLELDRRRLTAGDEFVQSLFGHDDTHGYGSTAGHL
jgi:hypothetical protein